MMMICIAVFVLGIIVYIVKNEKYKLVLAVSYFGISVVNLVVCFISCWLYVVLTCGLGVIFIVPQIFQTIAGIKFILGAKAYYGQKKSIYKPLE